MTHVPVIILWFQWFLYLRCSFFNEYLCRFAGYLGFWCESFCLETVIVVILRNTKILHYVLIFYLQLLYKIKIN